ncbi:response regulator [Paenibacillus sp. SYP-B4298]|uniref:response regulator n=1 Tax=Paenibacillus sp. SYP-B4298 TaxID=2996034 RepID=UPI0022DDAD0D|nr:response regulator [Paenibacillus sp. SYP-B4298]
MERKQIKAIIVDDEVNARKIVPIIIDWQLFDFEFVGEASNGSEALDLIEAVSPDVVFTDISMPYMDGLELSRLIRERHPFIKIVVITAHPEFEYAKRSLHMGVQSFILKPLRSDEVKNVAIELRTKIQEEAQRWNEYQHLQLQLKENIAQLKEKFLNDVLAGLCDSDQLCSRFEYFFPKINSSTFTVMVFELNMTLEEGEEQRLLQSLRCRRFIDYAIAEYEGIESFFDNSQRVVLLDREGKHDLALLGEQLTRSLVEKLGCQMSIGVGCMYTEIKQIKTSYKEALEALRYGKLHSGKGIYFFNDDMQLGGRAWEGKTGEIEEILFFIKAGIQDKAVLLLNKLFYDLEQKSELLIERAKLLSAQFVVSLTNAIVGMGMSLEEGRPFDLSLYSKIFGLDEIQDIKQIIVQLVTDVVAQVTRERSKKTNGIMKEMKDFIQKEMHSPEMSLSFVSSKFHMNSSYFSRIFKQDTGISFTDYLLKCRMEKAVKLLNETDWKAYQIAEKVGIKDPFYFSNCFKKFMGVSIQEYKRSGG